MSLTHESYRGENGSDTVRIVVKPYLYPFFFFPDTDTDRILDGYGYGSDRIFIKKYI